MTTTPEPTAALPYGLTIDWIARLTKPQTRALSDVTAERGACSGVVDPELFFPVGSAAEYAEPAVRICQDCPMRACCLAYALASATDDGVWGGYSDRQRRPWLRAVLARRCEIEAEATATTTVGGGAAA